MKKMDFPNDAHVFRMTDDTGMIQHAKFSVPDLPTGYTTDDNARALVMAVLLYETTKESRYLDLCYRYISFLLNARKGAWFRNFMDYNRNFVEEKGSQDCFGRCVWCLGFSAARTSLPDGIRQTAQFLLRETAAGCEDLKFIRSKAYAVLGLRQWKGEKSDKMVKRFAGELAQAYENNDEETWHWFESRMTYCNSVLPWAMLSAYEVLQEKRYLEIGLESLDFLSQTTFRQNHFHPIGCNGWLKKGEMAAPFDQQPVEACEMLLVCLKAFELSKDEKYIRWAKRCLGWYTGENSAQISLIDPDTGGCMDGITPIGPNCNEGAESLVSWLIARLAWEKAIPDLKRRGDQIEL